MNNSSNHNGPSYTNYSSAGQHQGQPRTWATPSIIEGVEGREEGRSAPFLQSNLENGSHLLQARQIPQRQFLHQPQPQPHQSTAPRQVFGSIPQIPPFRPQQQQQQQPRNDAAAQRALAAMQQLDAKFWKEYSAANLPTKRAVLDKLCGGAPEVLQLFHETCNNAVKNSNTTAHNSPPLPNSSHQAIAMSSPNQSTAGLSQSIAPQQVSRATFEAQRREADIRAFHRLLPPNFESYPRHVVDYVKDFSIKYLDKCKSEDSPNTDSLSTLKLPLDPRPAHEIVQQASSGLGRLTALLPATDQLDREASSFSKALILLSQRVDAAEERSSRSEARVTELEKEVKSLQDVIRNAPNLAPLVSPTEDRSPSHSPAIESRAWRQIRRHMLEMARHQSETRTKLDELTQVVSSGTGEQVNGQERTLERRSEPAENESLLEAIVPSRESQVASSFEARMEESDQTTQTDKSPEQANIESRLGRMRSFSVRGLLDQTAQRSEDGNREIESRMNKDLTARSDQIEALPAVKDENEQEELNDDNNEGPTPATPQVDTTLASTGPPASPPRVIQQLPIAAPLPFDRTSNNVSIDASFHAPAAIEAKKRKRDGIDAHIRHSNGKEVESIVIDSSDEEN